MKFDAYAVLAELRGKPAPGAIHAIRAISPGTNSTNSTNSTPPAPKVESPKKPAVAVASPVAESIAGLLVKQPAPDQGRAFRAAVQCAFEDYAATDNPHDPRAWE